MPNRRKTYLNRLVTYELAVQFYEFSIYLAKYAFRFRFLRE